MTNIPFTSSPICVDESKTFNANASGKNPTLDWSGTGINDAVSSVTKSWGDPGDKTGEGIGSAQIEAKHQSMSEPINTLNIDVDNANVNIEFVP